MNKEHFGVYKGQDISRYTLANNNGLTVTIMELGGRVLSLFVPDRDGNMGDILLGYETLKEYIDDDCCFNCLVGRYANRIAGGRFTLGGIEYNLDCNDGPNHLHGGLQGLHTKIWHVVQKVGDAENSLRLRCSSPDGEGGYPGNLDVEVVYALTDDNEFIIEYEATTDADTVLCLTWHGYFNLATTGIIVDHQLKMNASQYTPVDGGYIPTGELIEVTGDCLDFRELKPLSQMLDSQSSLLIEGGFDHNFVLDTSGAAVATLVDPFSGRRMDMYTSEPAIQFYTGNFLDGRAGKNRRMEKYAGLCLEAQHFPDSPNKKQFPSVTLSPSEVYRQRTAYRFSVEEGNNTGEEVKK